MNLSSVTATAGVSTSSLSIDTSPSTDYNSNSHNTDNHWEGNSNSDNNSDSYNDSLLSGSGFNSPEVSVNTAITGSTGNSGSTERKQRARSMIVIDRLSPVRGDHTLKDLLDLSNGDYNYNYDNNGNYNSSPSQAVRHRADGSIFIQNSSSSKIFIAERAVELKAVEKVFRSWRKVHQHRVSMKNSMIASAKRRATISGQTMAVSVAAAISGNAPTTNIDGVSSIASQAKPNLRKVGSSPLASTPAKRLSISSSTSAILGRAGLGANSTTNVNTNSNSNNRSGSTIRRRLSMTAAQPTKPLSSPTISVGSSISSKGGASSHSSHVSGNTVKNNTRPSVVSSPKTGTKQTAESIVKAPLANKFDSDKSIIKVPNGTTDCNSSIASCKPTVGIIKQSTPTDVTSLSMSSLSAKAAGYSSKLGERKSVRFSIEDGTKSTPQVDTAPKTPATASTSTQLNPSKRSNSFTSPTNTDATDFKGKLAWEVISATINRNY